jgi:cytochrome c-type biogenesis protein CcmH
VSDAGPTAAERPSRGLLAGLLVFVLLFGVGGYAWLGNPAGLAVAPGMAAPVSTQAESGQAMPSQADFAAMADRLAERLKTTPDDVEGWTMLGRSYSVLERFPQALQAFQRVLALRPQDAQAHADVADALAMTSGRKLDGEPERLIARALVLDPDNAKALGLAGTIAFERGDAATAARHWERALKATQPGSEMAARLREAVDEARKSAGLPVLPADAATVAARGSTAPAAAAVVSSGPPAGAASSVQARITLAPALASRVEPGDTLFIFARSPQGGRAPLAIQRRQAKDLPLDVTLDDSMAMSPAMRLSTVSQVIIGARISKSGNAMPQPGDLQGLSPVLAVGSRGLQLQISEVLP